MTVKEISTSISATILAGENAIDKAVTGVYICDLLSWIIGKAKEGDCLITVMGNINAVAVGALSDIACILLPEDSSLDADAKTKADQHGIPILSSSKSAYQLAMELSELLK